MSAINFPAALAAVLRSEGGWTDDPRDRGGPTMRGVTLERLRAWEHDPAITKAQLRNISDDKIRAIYHDGYWRPVAGDDLPSGLDYAMFDWAVNSGPARATVAIQRIVGVAPDGVMGTLTLSAIRQHDVGQMIDALTAARLAYVASLSTYSAFGNGWDKRIKNVRIRAHALAHGVEDAMDAGPHVEAPAKARVRDTKASAKPGVRPAAVATAAAIGTAATTAAQQLQGLSDGLAALKWVVLGLTITACAAGLYVALRGQPDA